MEARLEAALAGRLGARVTAARPLGGGDINDAFEVALGDGRRVFVKTNARAPRAMVPAEARGLAWLAEARALRIPAVVAVSDEAGDEPLSLWFERARPPGCAGLSTARPRADDPTPHAGPQPEIAASRPVTTGGPAA